MLFIALAVVGVGVATALVIFALRANTTYFYSPSRVVANEAPRDSLFRLGGLVKKGSVQRDGLTIRFIVTDHAADVPVRYTGILPDLFQEEKSIVAKGRLGTDGLFMADEVLAKHDEKYMPPEVTEAIERAKTLKKTAP